ncbi:MULTISPECIES: hypothetical protein [unclassified Pseudomonas]|uniref:hypothetical protein n=1 Tax=unclassified Pseudomonas TaxID=196821 RepID=UPI001B335D7F|nr:MULTISPECIES: hypothetical protein [unclassified Pseudomonas]MBP5948221.1 hypothetical protein [Pseudomonas sp. P9(2020)]MBZ9560696.1 hypothetical protein [Pseudomonas sp. P116]
MYELIVGDDATGDLEEILEENAPAAYRLGVFLQELGCDQDLLEKLSWDQYGGKPHLPELGATFSVSKVYSLYRTGKNIWRLRDFELSKEGFEYRIIYAYIPSKDLYFVLAVVERAFNYDPNHPVTQRVLDAYKQLEAEGW